MEKNLEQNLANALSGKTSEEDWPQLFTQESCNEIWQVRSDGSKLLQEKTAEFNCSFISWWIETLSKNKLIELSIVAYTWHKTSFGGQHESFCEHLEAAGTKEIVARIQNLPLKSQLLLLKEISQFETGAVGSVERLLGDIFGSICWPKSTEKIAFVLGEVANEQSLALPAMQELTDLALTKT